MRLPATEAITKTLVLLDRKSRSRKHTKNKSLQIRKRKAITTVVTGAILLAAVSSLGAFILVWSSTSLMQQRQEIEEVFSTQVNKLNEDILIEDVWFVTSPIKKVNVTVTNVGSLGTNVTQINLINSTTYAQFLGNTYTDGGMLPYKSFSKNITYSWTSGKTFNVQVITDRGNIFTTQVTAP
jgi:archaellum component FlaF (FlaF/FlaG flagellin family)